MTTTHCSSSASGAVLLIAHAEKHLVASTRRRASAGGASVHAAEGILLPANSSVRVAALERPAEALEEQRQQDQEKRLDERAPVGRHAAEYRRHVYGGGGSVRIDIWRYVALRRLILEQEFRQHAPRSRPVRRRQASDSYSMLEFRHRIDHRKSRRTRAHKNFSQGPYRALRFSHDTLFQPGRVYIYTLDRSKPKQEPTRARTKRNL